MNDLEYVNHLLWSRGWRYTQAKQMNDMTHCFVDICLLPNSTSIWLLIRESVFPFFQSEWIKLFALVLNIGVFYAGYRRRCIKIDTNWEKHVFKYMQRWNFKINTNFIKIVSLFDIYY